MNQIDIKEQKRLKKQEEERQAELTKAKTQGYTTGYNIGRAEGYQAGDAEGYKQGSKDGMKAGAESATPAAFAQGRREGFKEGPKLTNQQSYARGVSETRIKFVETIERKLAEHDGFKDAIKWREERLIPAWWIAVLITLYEPSYIETKERLKEKTPDVLEEEEE